MGRSKGMIKKGRVRMKKKILMKHILAALTMAAMVPISQAWAENYTLGYNAFTYLHKMPDSGTVTISKNTGDNINMGTSDTQPALWVTKSSDKSGTDFNITTQNGDGLIPGVTPNVDAMRVRTSKENSPLEAKVHNFTAQVNAINSDALTIGDESWSSNVTVTGNFEANVKYGSGIRASASKNSVNDNQMSSESDINIAGSTDITIEKNAVQLNSAGAGMISSSFGKLFLGLDLALYLKGGSGQNLQYFTLQKGAGVYAGYDEFEKSTSSYNQAAVHLGTSKEQGVDTSVNITLNAEGGAYGLWAGRNGTISVDGKSLMITANQANSDGIAATNTIYHSMDFSADKLTEQNNQGSYVVLNGGSGSGVSINMNGRENGMENSHAIYANGYNTKVISGENGIGSFTITGNVAAENSGKIDLHATDTDKMNSLTGDLTADGTGSSASFITDNVLFMEGNAAATNGGMVDLESTYGNTVTASDTIVSNGNGNVVSALYADNGTVNLTGASNAISSNYTITGDKDKERTLWAQNKGTINVYGQTSIAASNVGDNETTTEDGEITDNNRGIAIAAGMEAIGDSADYDMDDDQRSHVKIVYSGSVTGDIAAGYGGKITISANQVRALANGEESEPSLHLTGNALAANGGIVNIDLGKGGSFTGRADDYGDAGSGESSGHGTTFFNPAFSNEIKHGGAVNFTMGEGSTWKVKGQSWITSIDTNDAAKTEDILQAEDPIKAMENMATIDLVSANTDRNTYAHALTVYKMDGDAVFNMSLDGDRNVSDMLYMKKADGNYIINVVDPVTLDDMYAKRENGELFNGLRFATVGAGSNVTFRAVTVDQGVLNVEYEVGTDSYDGNDENGEYNSTAEDGTSGNAEKPGNAMVDGFFKSDKEPVGSSDNTASSADYMTLSETGTEEDSGTDTQTDAVNYKLMGRADEQISSAGKAIVAMSKVNYSNAVYMDRLNKRVGEARYLDGDDGLWVRLRHDRIGKDDAFRSLNTMMELGYEWKAKGQKDGEHRQGVAFDYMRGTADYTNVMGDGDVRRAGVWLYDTWLGDKGHYTDYVVKYGHLSNDFDIYAPTTADKISGDYNNDVWSVSAEYGRKKDIGSDWYFEPQAQLQYAYVTSADYTTSQGTKVKLDGIDSLIGRAGFRLGRDINEGNTVYFKVDVLHEFLGDQKVHASDITGVLDTTYENEGTWYDVGFGFSHRMGKDSYMFLDLEHSFGNDNDETYQINIGLSKAF